MPSKGCANWITALFFVNHAKLSSEIDALYKYCAFPFICLCTYLIHDVAKTGNISTEFGSPLQGATRKFLGKGM